MIVNFIFGILNGSVDSEERGKSYLFNVGEVEAANANTMAAFINDSLSLLWPKGNIQIFIVYDLRITSFSDTDRYTVLKSFNVNNRLMLNRNGGFKSIVDLCNVCYNAEEATDDYVKKLSPNLN